MEAVLVKNGVDKLAVEGSSDSPYDVPNVDLTAHHPTVNVPVLSHRSVGYGHNSFVRETLIEELADRAKGSDRISIEASPQDADRIARSSHTA